MMGRLKREQEQLFYSFCLEELDRAQTSFATAT